MSPARHENNQQVGITIITVEEEEEVLLTSCGRVGRCVRPSRPDNREGAAASVPGSPPPHWDGGEDLAEDDGVAESWPGDEYATTNPDRLEFRREAHRSERRWCLAASRDELGTTNTRRLPFVRLRTAAAKRSAPPMGSGWSDCCVWSTVQPSGI
jgi:hypothetical protein